jgi:ubiquinol-cytochrome c reductase cytochrome b subunit
VFAVLAGLGGLAQINPIWLYGPFRPSAVSTAAQPDWYVGWLEGALRLFPDWRITIAHRWTIAEVFWPGIFLPGLTFGLLYLWPFIEARVTRDYAEHHLLDRPRERPVRSAMGAGVLTFYVVLFVAGAQDVIAQHLGASIPSVTYSLRAISIGLPLVIALLTWKICRDLRAESLRRGEVPTALLPPLFPPTPNRGVVAPSTADEHRSGLRRAAAAAVGVGAALGGFLIGRRRRSEKYVIRDRDHG